MFRRSLFPQAAMLLVIVAVAAMSSCQQQSESDQNKAPLATTKQVTVDVSGMTWAKACPLRVRDALAALPWAKNVQVDYARKQATFAAEPKQFDEKAIARVLKEAGFGGKVK